MRSKRSGRRGRAFESRHSDGYRDFWICRNLFFLLLGCNVTKIYIHVDILDIGTS